MTAHATDEWSFTHNGPCSYRCDVIADFLTKPYEPVVPSPPLTPVHQCLHCHPYDQCPRDPAMCSCCRAARARQARAVPRPFSSLSVALGCLALASGDEPHIIRGEG